MDRKLRDSVIFFSLVSGGMQDWNYLHTNCFELTIEVSCIKFPPASDLPNYWSQNKASLFNLIGEVRLLSNLF